MNSLDDDDWYMEWMEELIAQGENVASYKDDKLAYSGDECKYSHGHVREIENLWKLMVLL